MKTHEQLQKDVMAEIKLDPQLQEDYTQIGVSVFDGVVTLSGLVTTYSKKLAAERAAQRVHGVKVVATDIVVKLGTLHLKTDTEIAEAVYHALVWNSAVNEDKIEVKVENGWVYLSGNVEWKYQKTYAENSVAHLIGVRGVINEITIKAAPIDTKEIKQKITKAFHRNATIDATSIQLETQGSTVTLQGKVLSIAEKAEAERIAWSTQGVLSVVNMIKVDTEVFA